LSFASSREEDPKTPLRPPPVIGYSVVGSSAIGYSVVGSSAIGYSVVGYSVIDYSVTGCGGQPNGHPGTRAMGHHLVPGCPGALVPSTDH